ncbi:MAG TPA: hypothetical protein VIN58_05885 [Roseateles sp.]
MESAKSPLAVALADERLGKGWRRSQTRSRVVAVLSALIAAAVLYSLFERFRVQPGESKPEWQTVASVDLRIGNPAGAAERGEARAKADVEAGRLQLQGFGSAPARAVQLKQRFGVTWVSKGREATLLTQAFADAYNRVVQAEIERRHGREALDELVRDSGIPLQQKKEQP